METLLCKCHGLFLSLSYLAEAIMNILKVRSFSLYMYLGALYLIGS